jgi:hypothetical protein
MRLIERSPKKGESGLIYFQFLMAKWFDLKESLDEIVAELIINSFVQIQEQNSSKSVTKWKLCS